MSGKILVSEISPLSPEARAHLPATAHADESEATWFAHLGLTGQVVEVTKRVAVGVYSDGFIHAGNFAYLSLVSLFAFCVVAAAIAGAVGQTESGLALIEAFFVTVPPSVGAALKEPIESAMTARSGPLLWLSAAVSLWTAASLIETFRDVLYRSYGAAPSRAFWHYRSGSLGAIIASVVLAMVAFSAQVVVTAVEDLVYRYIPTAQMVSGYFAWGRIIPFITLFVAIYVIFVGLTPTKYRSSAFPKWPGPALVSMWWLGLTALLPVFLSSVSNYDLTYGSLAGVMVALIFFYLIGLGLVTGAQLNAALANAHENGLKQRQQNSPDE